MLDLKCNTSNNIKAVYFIGVNDVKVVNGELKIKRKYGKFKRVVTKIK